MVDVSASQLVCYTLGRRGGVFTTRADAVSGPFSHAQPHHSTVNELRNQVKGGLDNVKGAAFGAVISALLAMAKQVLLPPARHIDGLSSSRALNQSIAQKLRTEVQRYGSYSPLRETRGKRPDELSRSNPPRADIREPCTLLHQKVMTIDGVWNAIGSSTNKTLAPVLIRSDASAHFTFFGCSNSGCLEFAPARSDCFSRLRPSGLSVSLPP